MKITPDATIEVRFNTTAEGGLKGPIVGEWYGIIFRVDDAYHDCRLLLAGRRLELGVHYEVPVAFLRPDLVLPKLAEEKPFTLWEGKLVATGRVIRLRIE